MAEHKRGRDDATDDAATTAAAADTAVEPRPDDGYRWWLERTFPAYGELVEEQRRGWASAALDALYADKASFMHSSTAARAATADGAAAAAAEDEEEAKRQGFWRVKLAKYQEWAAGHLPQAAPGFFRARRPGAAFLDLGSAPGGLSAYVNGELRCRPSACRLPSPTGACR